MATQAPAGVDAAGLQIFQEVLQSLMLQHPLEETLGLISRRVCELGEFDFCGIVMPDDQWEHMHLAASPGEGGAPRRAVRRVVPPVARARDGVRLPIARVRSARRPG